MLESTNPKPTNEPTLQMILREVDPESAAAFKRIEVLMSQARDIVLELNAHRKKKGLGIPPISLISSIGLTHVGVMRQEVTMAGTAEQIAKSMAGMLNALPDKMLDVMTEIMAQKSFGSEIIETSQRRTSLN